MISGARGQTEYDVIVAGAGPTGICAAIAAGRTGARTLLVERFPFPGGEAVTALNLHGWHDNSEEHIIRGIPWEIILRLKGMQAAAGAPFEKGRDLDGTMQPVSMMSTFGGVDLDRAVAYFNHRRAEVIEGDGSKYSRYMHFTLPLDEWMDDVKRCCFLPRGIENLLVAGRCLSASHEAHASARVMGTCMGMGHAVGTAAAMAVQAHTTPRELEAEKLQQALLSQGAYLGARGMTSTARRK